MSISCFLGEIPWIEKKIDLWSSPDVHFMLSGTYSFNWKTDSDSSFRFDTECPFHVSWERVLSLKQNESSFRCDTNFPSHAYLKILILCPDFKKLIKRTVRNFRHVPFWKLKNELQCVEIYENMFETCVGIFFCLCKYFNSK